MNESETMKNRCRNKQGTRPTTVDSQDKESSIPAQLSVQERPLQPRALTPSRRYGRCLRLRSCRILDAAASVSVTACLRMARSAAALSTEDDMATRLRLPQQPLLQEEQAAQAGVLTESHKRSIELGEMDILASGRIKMSPYQTQIGQKQRANSR